MASSFRAFFALGVDLAVVANEACDRAAGGDKAVASRTRAVRIVRVDRMPTEPPLWLQSRPHWGIVVDDTLYHLLAHPCDGTKGDISTAVCAVAWVSWSSRDAAVQGVSHAVGTTDLAHNSILDVLSHIVTAFGTNLTPNSTNIVFLLSSSFFCLSDPATCRLIVPLLFFFAKWCVADRWRQRHTSHLLACVVVYARCGGSPLRAPRKRRRPGGARPRHIRI